MNGPPDDALSLDVRLERAAKFFTRSKFTGNVTAVDLIAASTNAPNGAMLTRPVFEALGRP